MHSSILKYESDIWKTADLLIGAGIKQSDFPKFMMPFFALIMVESRLVRGYKKLDKEIRDDGSDAFKNIFRKEAKSYNKFITSGNMRLATICKNDKTFKVDFFSYLRAFDSQTKKLLGVDKSPDGEKFLDILGVIEVLKNKGILFDMARAWGDIDLTPFDNSEITTLEEHIKRKWADISAETAGEQYTPADIIALISEVIASNMKSHNKVLDIYDPTCGGGNLLFGVADRLKQKFNRLIRTCGDEWNDTLYALAKIESRFRQKSEINHCNTLTEIKHIEKKFDCVIANPPYGVDWKGYQKDIRNDTTGRFKDLPAISDGQFLFTQHILYHLKDNGISVVVHNGSTLFSGDAGSGESNIRKYFFDQDWVEAIIQMPTDEFFNTGIYTYLWVFNKNKPAERKDKLILIDGSNHWEPLKKSKGKKRKQMHEEDRRQIVEALNAFKDNAFAKVFDKWHFYYNKQAIMLTHVDERGKAIEMPTHTRATGESLEAKSITLSPIKISYEHAGEKLVMTDFEITEPYDTSGKKLKAHYDTVLKPQINGMDYKTSKVVIHTAEAIYFFDVEKNTLIEKKGTTTTVLGCGKINIKASFSKATKSKHASIHIGVTLAKDLEKDYEIIPYHPDKATNEKYISDFMATYVSLPFTYLDNLVGVELNFNKVFYQPAPLRSVAEIQADLAKLDEELKVLEKKLDL